MIFFFFLILQFIIIFLNHVVNPDCNVKLLILSSASRNLDNRIQLFNTAHQMHMDNYNVNILNLNLNLNNYTGNMLHNYTKSSINISIYSLFYTETGGDSSQRITDKTFEIEMSGITNLNCILVFGSLYIKLNLMEILIKPKT